MPARSLQEILINDFSPGIFSHREFAATQAVPDGAAAEFINAVDDPIPETDYTFDQRTQGQDLDVSARLYTFGCVGSDTGLRPLPARVFTHSDTAVELDTTANKWINGQPRQAVASTGIMTGIWPNGDPGDLNALNGVERVPYAYPDIIHVAYAWAFGSPRKIDQFLWRTYANRNDEDPVVWTHDLLRSATVPVSSSRQVLRGAELVNSYISGSQRMVLAIRGVGGSSSVEPTGDLETRTETDGTFYFPAPGSSGNGVWSAAKFDSGYSGEIAVHHQNRLLLFATSLAQDALIGLSGGTIEKYFRYPTNRTVQYNNEYLPAWAADTDPEASKDIDELLTGTGAVVSMNSNELFIVMNTGGGVVVRGDIAFGQTVSLPGVDSTYGAANRGVVTSLGYVYGSRDGIFAWNGADASEHLSPQLGRTWFWNLISNLNDYRYPSTVKGKFGYRHPYVYVTNNWVMDIRTRSWWRLIPPSTERDYFAYETSVNGNVYAINSYLTPTEPRPIYDVYTHDRGTSSYRWISQPLIRTRSNELRFREVRVTAVGKSDISVTLVGINGVRETVDFPAAGFSNSRARTLSAPCRIDAEDVTVVVNVDSGDEDIPAATIHRIAFGYADRHSVENV